MFSTNDTEYLEDILFEFEIYDETDTRECHACFGTGMDKYEDADCLICYGDGVI
jgi:hypothetical protein